jgi:hypothetical protein
VDEKSGENNFDIRYLFKCYSTSHQEQKIKYGNVTRMEKNERDYLLKGIYV